MQMFKVAGYIRLSKEDKIKDESNSVTNQKLIITSYIKKNEDFKKILETGKYLTHRTSVRRSMTILLFITL